MAANSVTSYLTLLTFIIALFFGHSIKVCQSLEGLPGFSMLIRVDQSGEGDYEKIQDAIDAVPSNNSEPVFVWVKPGVYEEKIVVPADKPFITLSGSRKGSAVVTWNESGPIFEIATVSVLASDFTARYLTIQVGSTNCWGRNRNPRSENRTNLLLPSLVIAEYSWARRSSSCPKGFRR